jgi:hypothetical protein
MEVIMSFKYNKIIRAQDPNVKKTVSRKKQKEEFLAKQEFLADYYEEVEPLEYYREMFPEDSFEMPYDLTCRPNGMLNVIRDEKQRGRSYARMIFDDLEEIEANLDKKTVVISPVGYSGKHKSSKNAYQIFGMIFDLDDVGVKELHNLLYQMENGILPYATYIVNSGTGVHVVYLFETPIPAMKKYYDSLNALKAALSELIWTEYTSREKKKQFQGIFQSFRAVGSSSKLGADYRVTAYRIGEKTCISELNYFVSKENRCEFDDLCYTNLNEAEEKWPEWYRRRIVEGRKLGDYKLTKKEKNRRRGWYEAWKKHILNDAHEGNRHYCVGVLFNYARKAEIPQDEAYGDAMKMLPWLDSLTNREGNEFTEADIAAATRYYGDEFIKMGRKGIFHLTQIDIGQTKRNKRSQKDHLQSESFRDAQGQLIDNPCKVNRERTLQAMRANGEITGRPDKQKIVQQWRAEHPDGKKADCIRDTGLTKPTVYKWWAMAS